MRGSYFLQLAEGAYIGKNEDKKAYFIKQKKKL